MKNRHSIKRKFIRVSLLLLMGIVVGIPLSFAQRTMYHIGDVIQFRDGSTGVVCYVNPDNPQEGWVMDIVDVPEDEENPTVRGKFVFYDNTTLPFPVQHTQVQNHYDESDWIPEGRSNTQKLKQTEKSPLMKNHYVAEHYHNGWYIPDIQQLTQMFYLSIVVKDSVEMYGGNVFLSFSSSRDEIEYWSSSAISDKKVQTVLFSSGHLPEDCPSTSSAHYVRLVRDFKVGEAYAYWEGSSDTNSNSMTVYAPSVNEHFRVAKDTVFQAIIIYGDSVFNADPTTVHMHPVYLYQDGDNRTIPQECVCQRSSHYKKYGFDLDVSEATDDYEMHYRWDLTKKYKCDSLIRLELRVDPVYEFHDTVSICETELPFYWKGNVYNGTTVDFIKYQTEFGCHCDSIWWLHLFVAPMPKPTITIDGPICQNEDFTLTASNEYCFNAVPTDEERFANVTVNDGAELENDSPNSTIHKIASMTLFEEANYAKWNAGDKAISVGAAGTSTNRRYARIFTKPLDLSDPFVLNLNLRGWGRPDTATEAPSTRVVVTVKSADGTTVQRDSLTIPGYKRGTNDAQYYNDYHIRFDAAGENAVIEMEAIDEPQINPETGSAFGYADQRFYMKYFSVNKADCDIKWYDLSGQLLPFTENVIDITTSKDTTLVAEATSYSGPQSRACAARDTATVRVINPTVTVTSSDVSACEGEDLQLTATTTVTGVRQGLIDSAEVSYHWTKTGGTSMEGQTIIINNATVNESATYTVTVDVDFAEGLCEVESEKSVNVVVSPVPQDPKLLPVNNTGCDAPNGSITVTSPIGTNYTYSIDSLNFQTSNVFSGLSDGSYTVYVKNQFNCTSSRGATLISEGGAVNVTASANSPCEGESIELVASTENQNVNFAWTGPNGFTSSLQNPTIGNADENKAGRYTIILTDPVTGCADTDFVDVTVRFATSKDTTAVACESFTWHGNTYTVSGNYTYEYVSPDGCTSVDTLKLTINYGTHNVETETACESYEWHGATYTVSGTYTHPYTNASGCASVDTLKLTINHGTHNVETKIACESYEWHGTTYTVSGTYTYAYNNADGCPSVDTLKLTVNYGTHNVDTETACESFTWHGTTYTTSGTYTYPYNNADGCPSVDTLKLTIHYGTHNVETETACESFTWHGTTYTTSGTYTYPYNNADGCPSVDTLKLTINYGTHNVETETACESFTWHGTTYTTSGTYTYPYNNADGCPSVDTLKLTINYGTHNVETETACESFTWHGTTYTTSGTYTYPYNNADGCPSVDTLKLTINYGTHNVETETACESFTWHGTTYTTSGIYTYPYTNASGCASVDTLKLTINYGTHNVETETACESYEWHGTTYTTSGTYTHPYTNTDGCASVDTLKLTINYGTHNVETETACESFTWHGTTYTTSGTYTYSYTNANGCASVDTLKLTINYGTHNVETETACESYEWHGTTYTTSGTYTYPYTNAEGCASVDTLKLTINYGTHNVETETACESYEWHGTTYTTSGTYTHPYTNDDGCASVDTLKLTVHYGTHNVETETACESFTWHGTTYTTSGTYAYEYTNADGCASADTLKLTVHYGTHNVETETACESYEWHGTTYTTSGTYTHPYTNTDGCSSVDTLKLTVHYGTHNVETETACESYEWHGTTYTTSGTYTYAYNNADDCPSVDTLKLTVHYGTHLVVHDTACESYVWHNVTYTNSGTYTHEYTNADGCASVDTLFLIVYHGTHDVFEETACDNFVWYNVNYTNSGAYTHEYVNIDGCLSVDTLFLTVNRGIHEVFEESACGQYVWHGQPYTTSGTYMYEYQSPDGCASVDTLHLTINNPVHEVTTHEQCGGVYTWHGTEYDATGTYTFSHEDANHCTQVDTLHLTINPVPDVPNLTSVDNPSCEGEEGSITVNSPTGNGYSYSLDGGDYQTFTTFGGLGAGTFTVTVKNEYGCTNSNEITIENVGSTVNATASAISPCLDGTIQLTANSTTAGVTYAWSSTNGFTSNEQNPTRANATAAMNGSYTVTVTETATGCTATATTNVSVRMPSESDTFAIACETFDWYEHHNITESCENLTHIFTNAAGCDSVVTLHLTINKPVHTASTVEKCESYTWSDGDGITYTSSGNYTYSHEDANGCTQVDTLHLTINKPEHTSVAETACEQYEWNGTTYYNSGIYMYSHLDAHGCTQVDTLHLTINNPVHKAITVVECEHYTWTTGNGVDYTTSGDYTYSHEDANGCTQVDTLHLTINNPVHTATTVAVCDSYTWTDGNGLTYSTSGNYTYSHTDGNGCTQVDTLHLTIYPKPDVPTLTFTNNTSCLEPNGTITVTAPTGDGYRYSINGGTYQTGTTFSGLGTGTFTITVKNSYECTNVNTASITTIGSTVNATASSISPCLDGTIQLTANSTTAGVTYAWSSTNGFTSNEQNPTRANATTAMNGSYTVTVTETATGCTATATTTVAVKMPTTGDTTVVACETFDWYEHHNITESCDNLTHIFTNAAGCDSVVTLKLTINKPVHTAITVEECEHYTWTTGNGLDYTTSGDYTYSHEDANGCTQVDTLHLTINNPVHTASTVEKCESYTWSDGNGITYTTSGDYTYSHEDANGCTQVDTLHLTINKPEHTSVAETACEQYEWNGTTYYNSGIYTYSHLDAHGCTQVDTLHLTINNPVHKAITVVECEHYTWTAGNGLDYTTSGDYTYSHEDANGCTQVDTLHLTINNPVHTASTVEKCESYTWSDGNGITYTTSGDYTYSHEDANGCTQVDTLHLTINKPEHTSVAETACEQYEWNSTTYYNSGIYTYSHLDAHGCTQVDTLHLTINNPVHKAITVVECEHYTWTTGNGVDYTTSGDYTYSHEDANGCTQVDTLHLTINNPVHTATTVAVCDSYTWTEGNGETYTTSGDRTYSHTDGNGCTQVDTLHLTIYPKPDVPTLTFTNNTSCLEPNGTITVTAPTGSGYSYSINGGTYQTGTTFGGLGTGTYTIRVRNSNECTNENTASITTIGSTVNATASSISPCLDGTIQLTANSTTAGVTYAWSSTNGFTSNEQNPTRANATTAMNGSYTVTVTETATGCTATATTTVAVKMPTTGDTTAVACETFSWYEHTNLTESSDNLTHIFTNAAGCDSVVTLKLTINKPVHTASTVEECEHYTWTTGNGVDYTTSGDYTYSHEDANGCTQVDTLHLTINNPVHTASTVEKCESYTWSDGNGVTYTTSGDYTYSHEDANGCTQVDTLHLTINKPEHTSVAETACEQYEWNGTTYYNSGVYTYSHLDAHGCTQVDTLHLTINNPVHTAITVVECEHYTWTAGNGLDYTTSGDYTYSHEDANGCIQVDTLHLTINNPVHTATTVAVCDSYTWTEGNGETYTTSGDRTYSHTDAHGCTQVDTLHLTIYQNPDVPTLTFTNNTSCLDPNGTITVTAPVGDGYSYSINGGVYQTGTTFGGLGTGSYTITVKNGNECTSENSASITTIGSTVSVEADAVSPCKGGTVELTATPNTTGVTFAWTGPNGYTSTLQNPTRTNADESMNGQYTVVVTETATGCTASDNATVTLRMPDESDTVAVACETFSWYEHTNLTESSDNLTHTFTNAEGCDSIVTLKLTINKPVHTATTVAVCDSYTWTSGNGLTYSTSGNYTYSHTDGNGCTQVDTLHLTIYPKPDVPTLTFTNNTSCLDPNGTITVTAPVGDGYSYSINGGVYQTGTTFGGLGTGSYTIRVKNGNECTNENSASITTIGSTVSVEADAVSPCKGGTVELTATPNTTGVTFAWTGPNGYTSTLQNPTRTNADESMSGQYTVVVTETATGCTASDNATVTLRMPDESDTVAVACETFDWYEHTNLTESSDNLTHTFTNAEGCDSIVTLKLTIYKPVHTAITVVECEHYTWTAGNGLDYTVSGDYTYSHTDGNGCTQVDTLHLTINNPVHTATTVAVCDSYTWTSGNGLTYSTSGNYTYSHTDGNGCTQVDTLHLTIYPKPDAPTLTFTNNTSCLDPNGTITVTAPVGDGYSYSINGGVYQTGTTFGGLGTGSYTITVKNGNECTSENSASITTIGSTVSVEADAVSPCKGGTVELTATPNTTGVTFSWTGPNGYTSTLQNPTRTNADESMSGQYTVTVTETATGCTASDNATVTLRMPDESDTIAVACETFSWYEHTNLTESSDNLTHTFTNAEGCDSIVTLKLTINKPVHTAITVDECEHYTWTAGNGLTYSTSGNYTYSHTDGNGCTQVDTLHLTIHNPVHTAITVVECEHYTWTAGNGLDYTTSGDYTYSHADANGCTQVDTLHLTINKPVHTATTVAVCDSYTWTSGNGLTYSTSGNYTYSHTDGNGCTQVDTLHLTIYPKPDVPTLTFTNNTSCLEPNGTITVTAPVGSGYSYSINGGTYQSSPTFGGLGTGTYTITVKNSNDCTNENSASITTIGSTVSVEAAAVSPCKGGTVELTATPNTTGVTFAWTGPNGYTSTLQNPTRTNADESMNGQYTVVVTETATGCTASDNATVSLLLPDESDTVAVACETFDWYEHHNITESCDNLTHTFTNAEGCDSIVTLKLTINKPVHTATTVEECEHYTWTAGSGLDYTTSGDYTYSHTDAHGCTQVDTLHLTIKKPVHTAITVAVCDSYTWTAGNGLTYSTSGNYTYSHTDGNGCTQVDTLHLTIYPKPDVPTLTFTNNTSCLEPNGTITVTAPVGSGYSYSINGGTYQSSPTFGGLGTGSYTITVKNSNDCTNENSASITTIGSTVSVEADAVSPCQGGTIELSATPNKTGVTFSWTGPNGYTSTLQNPTRTNADESMNGQYTVVVTETATGCTASDNADVAVKKPTTGDTTAVACETFDWYEHHNITESREDLTHTFVNAAGCDSVVTLHLTINKPVHTATSHEQCGGTYTWNGTTYNATGTYTYPHTDGNGCTQVDTLHLTIHPLPATPSLSKVDNPSCVTSEGSITVNSPTGSGYTYSLNGVDFQTSTTFPGLGANTYTVTVKDEYGCTSTGTIPLENVGSTVTAFAESVSPCLNGTIQLSASSTTAGVTFAWTGPNGYTSNQQNPTRTNATTAMNGNYTVTVTETATGCTASATTTVAVKLPSTGDTTAVACETFDWYEHHNITESREDLTHTFVNAAGCDSVVTLHLTINKPVHTATSHTQCGGTYTWNGTTYSATGNYTYPHLDAHGCTQVDTLHLTINPLPVPPTLSASNNTSCLTPNGSIIVTYPVGSVYSYALNGGDYQTTTTFAGLAGGNYTVIVKNEHGCINSAATTLIDIGSTVTATANAISPCQGGDIQLTSSSETFGATFAWTGPDGFTSNYQNPVIGNATAAKSGDYTVTVTQPTTGCTATATATVAVKMPSTGDTVAVACETFTWHGETYTQTPTIAPTFTMTNAVGCDSVVTLLLTINHKTYGDTTAIECETFTWHGETYTESTNTPTFTMTNVAGCDSVVTLHLTINNPVHTAITVEQCGGTYTWTSGNGTTYSTSGTYTYSHQDANGCTQVDTLHLTIHPLPGEVVLAAKDNTSCVGSNGQITVTSPTGSGYTYSLNGTDYQTSTTFSPLAAGFYTVTVKNEYGCTNEGMIFIEDLDSEITASATANSPCQGETVELEALTETIDVTYAWSGPNGFTSNQQNPTISNATEAMNGDYTVIVTEIATGCTDTATTTVAVRLPSASDTVAVACDSFSWYGVTYTESTNTPTYTLTNAAGCDSVVTLNLTIKKSTTGVDEQVACNSYTWIDGITYTESTTTPTVTLENAAGCDSVVTLHLTVNHTTYGDTTVVTCESSFTWHDSTYTETPATAPTFLMPGGNHNGCDSIVTLRLTFREPEHQSYVVQACEHYEWNGTDYTDDGTYIYPHLDAYGCEQVDTLHLTIGHSVVVELDTINCGPFEWDGVMYDNSGYYTHVFTAANGCDSIVNILVDITHEVVVYEYDSIPAEGPGSYPFEWRGQWIEHGGMYHDTIITADGQCDSLIHHLFITVCNYEVDFTVSVTPALCNDHDAMITVSDVQSNHPPFIFGENNGGAIVWVDTNYTGYHVYDSLEGSNLHVVIVRDSNGCFKSKPTMIRPGPPHILNCPPTITDTLVYGETYYTADPDILGKPIVTNWDPDRLDITNDAPSDYHFYEGDNVIHWEIVDTVCSNDVSWQCEQHVIVIFPECPSAVDCEGHVYAGVRVGNYCWTQRNLESLIYGNGCTDSIPCVYEYSSNQHPDPVANVATFGRLYCYEAAVRDSADNGYGHIQGICPDGWYLPTPEQYAELFAYGDEALKTPNYWVNGGGNNSTGFSWLPAGRYNGALQRFEGMLSEGYFWAVERVNGEVHISTVIANSFCDSYSTIEAHEGLGYSVRCIKENN